MDRSSSKDDGVAAEMPGSEAVRDLHHQIDGLVGQLVAHHAARLTCHRGCAGCCVDDITVFEVEAARIRSAHAELLAHGTPHEPGACAFLDEHGSCRVYAHRPYVCRTQGLPLRWVEEDDEGAVERRDICSLNDPGPPIVGLRAGECWTLGPAEAKLRAIQQTATPHDPQRRVSLRSLFVEREAGRRRAADE